MNLLDAIGSLFVYRSPEPFDGLRSNLRYLSNKKLQVLAETKTHYSKTILINMIIDEIKDRDKN
tara:strand:- start:304 stop:495 length:192 start_codon:yes stop_codon:yes gene_type:complete